MLSRVSEDGTIKEEQKGKQKNWLIDVLKYTAITDMKMFNELLISGLMKASNTELH